MAELVMPKFGLTMTEGLLTEWLVEEGDAFSSGQPLFSVETEKVVNEVVAESDGVLTRILLAVGETAPVGTTVAIINGDSGQLSQDVIPAPAAEAAAGQIEVGATAGDSVDPDQSRVLATPLARRIARNEQIELSELVGSGPRGRIKAADVEAAMSLVPGRTAADHDATVLQPDAARLATARRVSSAKREIPHFYVNSEAEISALKKLRAERNADQQRARISSTHCLVKAVGRALRETPELNRVWTDDKIISFDQVDIGLVVDTDEGIRIPMLRDVGDKSLDWISERAAELVSLAKEGKLTQEHVGDGVLSISNVGMFGITSLTPIINPPNSMILGVGGERRLFRPDENGNPSLHTELSLTLACDHRLIDGAAAARFLTNVVERLENPHWIVGT